MYKRYRMLEKIKNNMNIYFAMALGNLGIANMILFIGKEHSLSLIMFAIVGVLIGLGDLFNQNKNNEAMIKKLIVKSREDIIYERMEDSKNGKCKVLTQEEMDELLDSADKKDA